MRQPTLSQWVVNADEIADMDSLSAEWDLEIHPFSEE